MFLTDAEDVEDVVPFQFLEKCDIIPLSELLVRRRRFIHAACTLFPRLSLHHNYAELYTIINHLRPVIERLTSRDSDVWKPTRLPQFLTQQRCADATHIPSVVPPEEKPLSATLQPECLCVWLAVRGPVL